MAIVWTKYWGPSDDGTVLKGIDLRNIQDDINTTGLADADAIQGFPVDAPTPADDGKALIYNDSLGKFEYGSLSGIPAGIYIPYGGAVAPAGWVLCDGSAISRTTYADLFTAISTAYGIGDGATTFNVPDMRGRNALGKDDMGGTPANRVTDAQADVIGGSLGEETKDIQHTHTGTTGTANSTVQVDDNSGGDDHQVPDDSSTYSFTTNNGGSATQDVMNPNLTGNHIIKT